MGPSTSYQPSIASTQVEGAELVEGAVDPILEGWMLGSDEGIWNNKKRVRCACGILNTKDARECSYKRTVLTLGFKLGKKLGSSEGKILG